MEHREASSLEHLVASLEHQEASSLEHQASFLAFLEPLALEHLVGTCLEVAFLGPFLAFPLEEAFLAFPLEVAFLAFPLEVAFLAFLGEACLAFPWAFLGVAFHLGEDNLTSFFISF